MLSSARHAKPARPSNVTKQLNNPTASQTATLGFSHKPDRRQFDTQSPTCLRHAPGPFAARLVTSHLLPTLLTTWEVGGKLSGKLRGCAEGLHGDRLRHYVNRVCFGTILNFPNLNTVRKTLAATESYESCQNEGSRCFCIRKLRFRATSIAASSFRRLPIAASITVALIVLTQSPSSASSEAAYQVRPVDEPAAPLRGPKMLPRRCDDCAHGG